MTSHLTTMSAQPTGQGQPWGQGGCGPWDELLAELDQLVADERDGAIFHPRLLSRTIAALGAESGAIWLRSGGELTAEHIVPAASRTFAEDWSLEQPLADVASHGQLIVRELSSDFESREPGARLRVDVPFLLWLQPIPGDHHPLGVLELAFRKGTLHSPPAAVVLAIADVIAEFHRGQEVERLRAAMVYAAQMDRFTRNLYHDLDLEATLNALVDGGREFLGCDRLSILLRDGKSMRVRAVSGVDSPNHRAASVRNIEQLSNLTTAMGEDFWFPVANSPNQPVCMSPEIEQAWEGVTETNHTRRIAILPLRIPADENPTAALVMESFTDAFPDGIALRAEAIRAHASQAIARATDASQVPFWPIWQALRMRTYVQRWLRASTVAFLALVVLLTTCFIPTNFYVSSPGTLQPTVRQNLFAPAEGEITHVYAEHGDRVQKGDALLQIESPDVDTELHRLMSDFNATQERLAAIRISRMETPSLGKSSGDHRLAAEEHALTAKLRGLQAQIHLAEQQQQRLTVRSPFAGHVLSWDLEQQLRCRPVAPGDLLLSIANLDGAWELTLAIPAHHAGYVAERTRTTNGIPVQFVLEADPGVHHRGRLTQLSLAAASEPRRGDVVYATVQIEAPMRAPRPGAAVLAKLDCGRRSIAFAWFHEFLESFRRNILF